MQRCNWAKPDHVLYRAYHDEEWGVPVHGEHKLFEMLVLEGAQAGLSWATILKKRNSYRQAFDEFDPKRVSRYDTVKQTTLLQNKGIVRNRLKIRSAINNACIFCKIQQEWSNFDAYIWHFVDSKPIQNAWQTAQDLPVSTPLAQLISKDLQKRGMNFVGPTIIYAFMQAVGLVNDHEVGCFRYREVER